MKSNTSFDLLAGRLVLNFLNTVEERAGYDTPHPATPTELLTSPDRLFAWCAQAHLASPKVLAAVKAECGANSNAADRLLNGMISLRENLFSVFLKLAHDSRLGDTELALLNEELLRLPARRLVRRVGVVTLDWVDTPSSHLRRLSAPIIQDAIELVTSPVALRIKLCAAKDCGWLFLDTSKSGKRRWCDMNDCGNREKQRRFRDSSHK
jgi:predicted RNA-binding Zn ribbon-like protein